MKFKGIPQSSENAQSQMLAKDHAWREKLCMFGSWNQRNPLGGLQCGIAVA